MAHRTHVYLQEATYTTLTDMSAQTGSSISEIVHQAVAVYRWYREVKASGGRVLVERDGMIRREVIFG